PHHPALLRVHSGPELGRKQPQLDGPAEPLELLLDCFLVLSRKESHGRNYSAPINFLATAVPEPREGSSRKAAPEDRTRGVFPVRSARRGAMPPFRNLPPG